MLFNSAAFALFLPAMLTAYWTLRGTSRRVALLVGSYFFYGWWDWRFLSLLMLSTVLDFSIAHAIDRRESVVARRRLLGVSLVANLGILGAFKYFDFFRASLVQGCAALGLSVDLPTLQVILPMGISFYTFQTISYTFDVYRGEKPERSLLNFAVYVSCFPQLVAGPILRASQFLPQIATDRTAADADVSGGVFRICRGLFKKMVVADALALYVDAVFAAPAGYPGLSSWIALYAYAFQIYMDFSGYTDVAIGCALLLGMRFDENFDSPYLARSPSDFWRRWHITLSTWLRDYLYIPLGGSRAGPRRTIRNLMITMGLGGLWHGAAWTFVAWGIYHGLLLSAERLLGLRGSREAHAGAGAARPSAAVRVLSIAAMFHLTCLGWLLFRAPDWATVGLMARNLVDFTAGDVRGLRCGLLVAACMMAHSWPGVRTLGERFARLPAVGQGVLAGVCTWALLLLSPSAKAFIYFQF
jgi:D-alanyl-lipoteichoic acid acyltransferase DltB (MBOAT superfamily)